MCVYVCMYVCMCVYLGDDDGGVGLHIDDLDVDVVGKQQLGLGWGRGIQSPVIGNYSNSQS